jgi:plasmid stabilization system protein ParE
MVYRVILSLKAISDIEDAFEYYSFKSLQALKNLDKELETAYKAISRNPHYKIKYKNIVGFPLKRFPYLLLYTLDESDKTILIYSVFNTYLNPAKYPK